MTAPTRLFRVYLEMSTSVPLIIELAAVDHTDALRCAAAKLAQAGVDAPAASDVEDGTCGVERRCPITSGFLDGLFSYELDLNGSPLESDPDPFRRVLVEDALHAARNG